jgi:hypothetical protein
MKAPLAQCPAYSAYRPLSFPAQQQNQVQTLIVEELRRLHEGVLSRYGLRPAQYHAWKNHRPSPR